MENVFPSFSFIDYNNSNNIIPLESRHNLHEEMHIQLVTKTTFVNVCEGEPMVGKIIIRALRKEELRGKNEGEECYSSELILV